MLRFDVSTAVAAAAGMCCCWPSVSLPSYPSMFTIYPSFWLWTIRHTHSSSLFLYDRSVNTNILNIEHILSTRHAQAKLVLLQLTSKWKEESFQAVIHSFFHPLPPPLFGDSSFIHSFIFSLFSLALSLFFHSSWILIRVLSLPQPPPPPHLAASA